MSALMNNVIVIIITGLVVLVGAFGRETSKAAMVS